MSVCWRASVALAAITVVGGSALAQQKGVEVREPITQYKPAFEGQTRAPEEKLGVRFESVVVATGLRSPWSIGFLPDGRMLVTERPGALRVIEKNGSLSLPVRGTPEVMNLGQGGLLDVVLDPAFLRNRFIYLSFAEAQPDGTNNTAVAKGKLVLGSEPRLDDVQVIYRQQPAMNSKAHFGSRLVFADDGTLFVTQAERLIAEGARQAQDLGSLLGKTVRINRDGSIPKDNPFVGKANVRPEIWSSGHRSIQAAILHPETRELWAVEYGPQGGDEINIDRKGKDYGWPTISYGVNYGPDKKPIGEGITAKTGLEQPLYYWDPVIAPSGMTFYTGKIFPAWHGSLFVSGQQPQGLPGGNVTRLTIKNERVIGEERLELPPAIWRDIRQGPDGAIYLVQGGQEGKILKLTAASEPSVSATPLPKAPPPKGWTYLPELGQKDIFEMVRSPTRGPVPQMRARTLKDVGILQKEIDVPLTADTTFQWQWIVKQLPSAIAEDIASAHDYFSIAVKFDNGQDLTYMWSAALPVDTGFRCPLKNWKDRETHVVVRSGTKHLNRWLKEKRNVFNDYAKYVGGNPPARLTHVWLIANSTIQKTKGEATFGGISVGAGSRGRTQVL